MRIKAVSKLIGGEILAEAILTKEKEILIPKGTELKKEYIPLIIYSIILLGYVLSEC